MPAPFPSSRSRRADPVRASWVRRSAFAGRRLLHPGSGSGLELRGDGTLAAIGLRQTAEQHPLDALLAERERADLLVDLSQLRAERVVEAPAERSPVLELEPQLLDLLQRESELLRLLDVAHRPQRRAGVLTPAPLRLRRASQQPAPLVEADRLHVDSGVLRELPDGASTHVGCLRDRFLPPRTV